MGDILEKFIEYSDFREITKDIENMRIRGANKIARMAAFALSLFARGYQGDSDQYFSALLDVAVTLYKTRPTAVSLENALLHVLNRISEKSIKDQKEATIIASEIFIKKALSAQDEVAERAASILEDSSTIHTHCNSTAVVEAMKHAGDMGKEILVHSSETRPRFQGRITVTELAKANIKCRMMVDSAARLFMDDVDFVMVGADTVTNDGALFNKIGTHQIALAARDCSVPFYCLAETFKLSPRTMEGHHTKIEMRSPEEIIGDIDKPLPGGIQVLNPAFDRTPPDLIKGIITERGIFRPDQISAVIHEMYEGKKYDYFYDI